MRQRAGDRPHTPIGYEWGREIMEQGHCNGVIFPEKEEFESPPRVEHFAQGRAQKALMEHPFPTAVVDAPL